MKSRKKSRTIFTKIFVPLFAVMILQSMIFYFATEIGGVESTLDNNAADVLNERVSNRKNDISSLISSRWTNISSYANSINNIYHNYITDGTPILSDSEMQKKFLLDSSSYLQSMLRNNSVNGAFLILTNSESSMNLEDFEQSYYGLCIRDYDIYSDYSDKEDLLIERCPTSLTSKLGCSLGSSWEAMYTFSKNGNLGDFFYSPLYAASEYPDAEAEDLAYFSDVHTLSDVDQSVISYSLPLIDSKSGDVYGVIGIELTTSHFASLLPGNELNGSGDGSYMLVSYEAGSNEYNVITSSGTLYPLCFGSSEQFTLDPKQTVLNRNNLYSYTGNRNTEICCAFSSIPIYNRNTPFENDKLALVGIVRTKSLFSVSTHIRKLLLGVAFLVLLIGFAAIFIVSHLLTRPIKRLSDEVQSTKSGSNTKLSYINIQEIDMLVDAIEKQTLKINQAKVRTEFFSRMSHDMRTPMNAIIGFSSPEATDNTDEKQLHEFLGKINGSGKYLLGLINEVLDMTKIDSGRMEIEIRTFNTRRFWDTTLPMIEELAVQKNITLETDINTNENVVIGDLQRISQILMNILSNAVKYTPSGGVVTLKTSQIPIDNENIMFHSEIIDTGIGMSEEFQKNMYQPFTQEYANKGGTGLGLSIAHELVILMGGTIDCKSIKGSGTTFVIEIPLKLAKEQELSQHKSENLSIEEIKNKLAGKRILLAEDHPLNRQIAARLLSRIEIQMEAAENGKIAVEMFSNSEKDYYSAILMDIRMPEMNGHEAAKAIREIKTEYAANIPIIAMTANAFREDIEASAAAGMNAHLSKPIEPQLLYNTLAKFISDKE